MMNPNLSENKSIASLAEEGGFLNNKPYNINICEYGEIGRHNGFKLRRDILIRVRLPLLAPLISQSGAIGSLAGSYPEG